MRAPPPLLGVLLATALACGSGSVRTELGDAPVSIPVLVSPIMEMAQPAPASWRDALASEVTFEGFIEPGSSPLTQVTIGERERPLQDSGRFIAPVAAEPGINIVGISSVAADGGRVADVRSFFAGDTAAPGEMLPSAMRLVISRMAIDDNDSDVDDLARMGELVMDGFEFKAGMVDPIELGIATMNPTAMEFAEPTIDLGPIDGGFVMHVTVYDVELPFDLEVDLGVSTVDTTGEINAYALSVLMDLVVHVHNDRLVLAASAVDAAFDGFTMSLGSIDDPGLTETLGSLAKSSVQTRLQNRIIETLETAAEDLNDYLDGTSSILFLDGALQLDLNLEELRITSNDITVDIGAAVSATAPRVDLYPDARGSLKTPGTPTSPPPSPDGVALVVDDDLINQLLFAAWYSGYLHGKTRTAEDLGESAASMPTAFQPVELISIDVMLPPVVTARAQGDEFFYDVSIGGIDATLDTSDGKHFRSHMGIRFPIGAESVGNSLRPTVDGRTNQVLAKTGCVAAPDGIAPSSVAGMLNLMIAPILRTNPVELPAVESMELGNLVSLSPLTQLMLSWRSMGLRALSGNTSFLVLDGEPVFK